jgi:hypothetical protein
MGAAIEAAMLDAHRAGLSVLPLRSNKRPALSTWKPRIDEPADELTVRREARMYEGFAILCGGPTRLQMLDFEGRFTEHIPELKERLGPLASVFESWLDGYMVLTPGGGFHVGVHVEGSDTQDGNTKLAMDGSGQTLVETRGHGGYVVAAPSNGTTHSSGKPWVQQRGSFAEIAWATVDQWRAVCAAISTFDVVAAASETPPEVLPPSVLTGGVSISTIERAGNSWIDTVSLPAMSTILDGTGWTYSHSDADHSYWARPDKDAHEGHSATVNANDRLFCFSTNAHPVPCSQPSGQTYDAVDVLGCYRFGHLPTSDERVQILRTFAGLSAQHPPAVPESPAPSSWLSDDFWESREWLSAIRAAAWGAQRCPEAILGAVLATYATGLPSSIKVEALVGGNDSPLNTYVALVGKSGSGKTGAIGLAMQLCGAIDSQDHRYGVSLRSGAGLVTAAIAEHEKRDKQGLTLPAVFRRGILIEFDEGKALVALNERSGENLLSYLLTAWSGRRGSKVGGTKGAGDESFPADLVRVCAVMGVQLGVAGSLFTGEARDQGFPGRLLYFGMNNLGDRSLRTKGKPAELGLPFYYPDQGREIGVMTFPNEVEEAVSEWDYVRTTEGGDVIDGHQMLLRMRTAAILALMDADAQVDAIHWQLSGEIEAHSRAVRSSLLAGISRSVEERAHAAGRIDAVREQGRLSATHERFAQRLARGLARATQPGSGEGVARKVWKRYFDASEREKLDLIVDIAIERCWAEWEVDAAVGRLRVGPAWLG